MKRFYYWNTRVGRVYICQQGDEVHTVRNNVAINRTLHQDVRAPLLALGDWIRRQHGYPPHKLEKAIETALDESAPTSNAWTT